ncbi:MAG: ATP-binding cassette domain-containing protein [Pseudomonadota bacterium]
MPEQTPKIIPFPQPSRAPAPPLRLEQLRLRMNGVPLLDGLDMTLTGRGISAIVGPNGAGKSVLLRVIASLLSADAGHVDLPGAMRGRVGLVFQRPVLLRRSVRGNLGHALRLARLPRSARGARLAELLALGRLVGLAERPARRLSGGEAQRLAIVRALASDPALLLVDEPTAHLDPQSTLDVETLLTSIAASGTKIVIVSHDIGQVGRLSEEVAFLHRGRCYEVTPTSEFLETAQSAEARAYLDGAILL